MNWAAVGGALALSLFGATGLLEYSWRHPGAWAGAPAALLLRALELAAAAALFLGAAGLGRRALERFRLGERLSPVERFLVGALLGELLLSYAVLALGSARLLCAEILWALLPALAALALAELRRLDPRARTLGPWEAAAAAVVGAALLRGAASAGAPPADWDSLVYHLALPKIYLNEGGLVRLPWTMTAHFPQSSEMLNLVLLSWLGPKAAQWLNWLHGAALLAAAGALGARLFGPAAAWPAAALLAVQPPFQRVLGTAKSDPYAALAVLLAWMIALRARESSRLRDWALAGGAAGAAAAFKLTGLWGAVGVAVLPLLARSPAWRAAGAAAAGAALLGAWWYARNWTMTGNPVWPFFGELFGAAEAELAAWRRLREADTGGAGRGPLQFLLLPYNLVFNSGRFTVPPGALIAGFLLLVLARGRRVLTFEPGTVVSTLVGVYLAGWFWVTQDGRYLLPVCAVAAAAAAGIGTGLWKEGRRVLAAAGLLLALSPLKDLRGNNEWFPFFGLRPADGAVSDERYLERRLGAPYALVREANRTLPADARVALLREVRGFYLDRPYGCVNPLDPGPVDFRELESPEELLFSLRRLGYTHALYNPSLGAYHGDAAYYERAERLLARAAALAGPPVASAGPLRLLSLERFRTPTEIAARESDTGNPDLLVD